MKTFLLDSSRLTKKIIVSFTDYICIFLSLYFADIALDPSLESSREINLFAYTGSGILSIFIFNLLGVYKLILRFIDLSFVLLIAKSIFFASICNLIFFLIIGSENSISVFFNPLKFTVFILSSLLLLICSRVLAIYLLKSKDHDRRVVIYGAGSAGIQLASALKVSLEMKPIAFIDANTNLHGSYIGGLKILDPKKLRGLLSKRKIDEVLIAIPSASKNILSSLLREIEQYPVKVRILPGLTEVAQGKVLISELKEVDIADLLGRYEVEPNLDLLQKNIKDKTVLITGAGGSIGSELTRQVILHNPKRVIILDSNEYALYKIKNEIESKIPNMLLESIIANVSNTKRINLICRTFDVNTVYHSAAYKHVPLVEENPFEGVINNIFGTKSCLEAAIKAEVETFVLISTDKAVRPTNIMGATKRFAELILQSYSSDSKISNKTRMTMVRFGNVLGSSGSAVPLFQKQIKEGGPVTVTDPEVIRYFMSIPEASELVIQAGAMGEGGDVFVLDMGDPVKIFDLAKRLINLSGLELKDDVNTEGDIEIVFTGLRPGEKLYEELLIGNNVSKTEHKQILRAQERSITKTELDENLNALKIAEESNDVLALKGIFKRIIDGYEQEKDLVDVISVHSQRNRES